MIDLIVKIFILANGIIILFFFQFLFYGIFTYFYYFRQKKNLNLSQNFILNLAKEKNKEIPYITIIIPAREEKLVISSTIERFLSLDYYKDKISFLLVLDDKELLKPFEETTHYEVYKMKEYYNNLYNREILITTSVPENFDGNFDGEILNSPVPSTKPRALNWALKFVPKQTEILGFYDADSQPEKNVLLYVAYKFLTKKEDEKLLLQGPVVQVRNYFNLKPFNKIYALAQAITHEWYYPMLLIHIPFIGGTNFFVEKELIYKIKGFNKDVLSEDLDLGCRLYMKTGIWPEFMPYVATEQTPPSYKSYFNQRVRWAAGYIQVLKNVIKENLFFKRKFFVSSMLIFYGILPWFAAQILAIGTMSILVLSFLGITYIFKFLPFTTKLLLLFMNFGYFFFLISYFYYALKKVYILNTNTKKIFYEYFNLLLLPFAAVLGTIPYTYGFITSFLTNKNLEWKKTIRTKEK